MGLPDLIHGHGTSMGRAREVERSGIARLRPELISSDFRVLPKLGLSSCHFARRHPRTRRLLHKAVMAIGGRPSRATLR